MKKINEANALTKECIVLALLRLMETKSYQSISITDITTVAGVSRMAYYRNYKNKDDILINHLIDQERKLLDDINNEKAGDLKEILIYVSRYFQDNAMTIKAVYDAGMSHKLTNLLGERIYSYFPVVTSAKSGRYAVHFYVGAMLSVFKLWFDRGMPESVDEISEIIYRLINEDNAMDFLVIPNLQN